jgi:hypothetical protein
MPIPVVLAVLCELRRDASGLQWTSVILNAWQLSVMRSA